jgi:hypothetical protein
MAVVYSPDSAYAIEARKWEGQHSQYGPPGRPYEYREYPIRLSRAFRPVGGGPVDFDSRDAADEHEERNLASRGFCRGREKALDALEKSEQAIAEAAANRAFHDRRMSEKAQREADAADAATAAHLPSIPEKPRRGRRLKPVEVPNG